MLGFVICSTSSIVFRRPLFGRPVKSVVCKQQCSKCCRKQKRSYSPLVALFNGGGGIFGVGTSELVVIGIVAWVVLGPKRLYALSKDLGRVFGELRQSAEEAKNTLVAALESELEEEGEPSTKDTSKPSVASKESDGVNYSPEAKLQGKSLWEESSSEETKKEETVDKNRKIFLEQMERLRSSNPQPPEELPDILKDITTSDKSSHERSFHSNEENTDVESELSALDRKYQELRNQIIEKKKLQQ